MEEKLYTVPVNDAFDAGTECPVCAMYDRLERDAVNYMMGPSYMEDDVRMQTNEDGFCTPHLRMLLEAKNRLGLALILKTHLDRQAFEAGKFVGRKIKPQSALKKQENADFSDWALSAFHRCYICDRINLTYPHYLGTVLYLYKKEPEFREKYKNVRGFCQKHAAELIEKARRTLKDAELQEFYDITVKLYVDNMKRVSDDLDWFINKFDYRFKDAPWKEAKDAIERASTKTNSIIVDEKG